MAERDRAWGSVELAQAAGVDDSYIRRLCAQRRLPGAYKIGKSWVIPADVGQQWLDNRSKRWGKF